MLSGFEIFKCFVSDHLKVSIKLWQNINKELFKVEYFIKLSQYFGNLAKAVRRSHTQNIS